jgi:phosphatidylserine synthase
MTINEPVTSLTDFAMAGASFVFAFLIARAMGPPTKVTGWFWCAAFVASGISSLSGAIYHGFAPHLSAGTLRSLWNITIYTAGAGGAFMTAGIHAAYVRREDGTVTWLVLGVVTTLVGFVIQQSRFPNLKNFNHNDLYHVIQIVALYFFFRCAQTIKDRPGFVS